MLTGGSSGWLAWLPAAESVVPQVIIGVRPTGLSVAIKQIASHQLTKIIHPVVDKYDVKTRGSTQRDGIQPCSHRISKANVFPRIYACFRRSTKEFLYFALWHSALKIPITQLFESIKNLFLNGTLALTLFVALFGNINFR